MSTAQSVNRQQFIFNFFLSLERGGTANCDSCRQKRPVVAEVRAGGTFANDTDTQTLTTKAVAAAALRYDGGIRDFWHSLVFRGSRSACNRERDTASAKLMVSWMNICTLEGCVTKSYIINLVAIHTTIICTDFQCFSKIKNAPPKRATIKSNIKPN